jgi:hypothetical protein
MQACSSVDGNMDQTSDSISAEVAHWTPEKFRHFWNRDEYLWGPISLQESVAVIPFC